MFEIWLIKDAKGQYWNGGGFVDNPGNAKRYSEPSRAKGQITRLLKRSWAKWDEPLIVVKFVAKEEG